MSFAVRNWIDFKGKLYEILIFASIGTFCIFLFASVYIFWTRKIRKIIFYLQTVELQWYLFMYHHKSPNRTMNQVRKSNRKLGKRVFVCDSCGKSFQKPSLLVRHFLVHNKVLPFRCHLCTKSFNQKVTLQKHLKNQVCIRRLQREQEKETSDAGDDLGTIVGYLSPSYHEQFDNYVLQNKSCIHCDKNFLKPSDLDRHILTHTNERNFKCPRNGCNKSFKLKDTMTRHEKTHDKKTLHCSICLSIYSSQKHLDKHMSRVHLPKGQTIQMYIAKDPQNYQPCKDTSTPQQLIQKFHPSPNQEFIQQPNQNIAQHDGATLKISEVESISYDDLLQSTSHQASFSLNNTLAIGENHFDTAIQEQKELIDELAKTFVSLQEIVTDEILNDFFKEEVEPLRVPCAALSVLQPTQEVDECKEMNTSEPKRKQQCNFCSKHFSKPNDLKRHLEAVHEKKKPFVCTIAGCAKSFSLKQTLDRHSVTHRQQRNGVECLTCKKVLSTTYSLNLHQRIHKDVKPHQCLQCASSFRTSGNLKSHLRTHMKESDTIPSSKSNFMVLWAI